jgi:hypothetical protein
MELTFEIGDVARPKGHALVYFRVDTEPDKVYATYVIALPVKADLAKYVPPFLASHLGGLPLNDFSAFAMPPVPEEVGGYAELQRLCRLRADDLVYATSMFSFDLPRMMEAITEAVQEYSKLYGEFIGTDMPDATGPSEVITERAQSALEDSSYQVNEVLFSLMSESDKLGELSRLLGRLRFALEGTDVETTDEVSEEISTLARYLPDEFRVPSLLAVAKDTSDKGSRLARLYLDRCFRLSAGDLNAAQDLEREIQSLRDQD